MKNLLTLIMLLTAVRAGAQITGTRPSRDAIVYAENYGARPGDAVSDKAGIQAAIDACATAGGGTVFLNRGVWLVDPLATGIGLLARNKVSLRGAGDATILRFRSSTSTALPWEGIAPYAYNTTAVSYGEHEVLVESLHIECDGLTTPSFTVDSGTEVFTSNAHGFADGAAICFRSAGTIPSPLSAGVTYYVRDATANTFKVSATLGGDVLLLSNNGTVPHYIDNHAMCHGLVGLVNCQRAVLRNVSFGSSHFHQIEIQRARNILVENCRFRGNTESERVQIDSTGSAGQRSNLPSNLPIYDITFRNCRFAGRNVTGQSEAVYRNVALDHTSNTTIKDFLFEDCEFGPVYQPALQLVGVSLGHAGALVRSENVTVRDCRFLGDCNGLTSGIHMVPGTTASMRGVTIENNSFGSGFDCDGTWFAGGFGKCLLLGTDTTATTVVSGVGGGITGHTVRSGLRIANNIFYPKFTGGYNQTAFAVDNQYVLVGTWGDATIENNMLMTSPYSSTWTYSGAILTTPIEHELEVNDPVRLTVAAGMLPTGFLENTTYYVVQASITTLALSDTLGGAAITPTGGSGTWTWTMYHAPMTMNFASGFIISEVRNLTFRNNKVLWQHSGYGGTLYTHLLTSQGLENGSIPHTFDISGNRTHSEVVSVSWSLIDAGTTSAFGTGRIFGNVTQGTMSNLPGINGHPLAYKTRTATTIAGGATTFWPTSNYMTMTASGACTIATITRGTDGETLTMRFTDANITFTDDNSGAANTIDLSAAFTSSARDTLTLQFNGTSWQEVSRAVN